MVCGDVLHPFIHSGFAVAECHVAEAVHEGGVGEATGLVVTFHEVTCDDDLPSCGELVLADGSVQDELEDGVEYVVAGAVEFVEEEDAVFVAVLHLGTFDAAFFWVGDRLEDRFDFVCFHIADWHIDWWEEDGAAIDFIGESAKITCFALGEAYVDDAHWEWDGLHFTADFDFHCFAATGSGFLFYDAGLAEATVSVDIESDVGFTAEFHRVEEYWDF